MRKTKRCVCTVSAAILAAAMTMSITAAAKSDLDRIAVPYQQADAWDQLAIINDENVDTGVYIRAGASKDSPVIGSLYQGGAAWVLNRGSEWTEICSGDLTGFVKNEYLLFGADAEDLAREHGIEGVKTTWEDVKMFADLDSSSDVVRELEYGDSFILLEAGSHWIEVQSGADDKAYVSADDVSRVLLLNTAVAKEGAAVYTEPAEEYYEAPSYSEPVYEESYESSYTENYDSSYDDSYMENYDTSSESSYTENYDSAYDSSLDSTYSESYDTGDSNTEDYYEESYEEEVYDADSAVVEDSYTEEDYGYYDADSDTYVSDSDYVEETPTASVSGDDVTLLGALIYCEAGNQSYEGMVAVGAVVMNRVYSASFPSTVTDVIYQSGQFTPAYSGALSSALANGVPSTCYDAAAAAISGENPVGGALYFNTGSGKGVKIGDHQFY